MKVELKYFDIVGRGEAIRIMLHGAYGSDWKDTRITFPEWSTVKPTTPLGCLPILSIDGTEFSQSIALYRYTAKLCNLYPSDPLQALIVDETMDILNDINSKFPKADTDDELKIKRQEFRQTAMKRFFDVMESRVQQFGKDTNTICGVPSVADVTLLTYKRFLESGFISHVDASIFSDEEYPGIAGVVAAISKHPIVVAYNASVEQSK
jgi:hypothetical protein